MSSKIRKHEALGLIVAIGLFIAFMMWVAKKDDESNKKDCQLKYATSECFKRKVKEAELKEAYEANLKGLKNE